MDLWEIDAGLVASGYKAICGVDEAGRGPLAGPVYAAAVILPEGLRIPGLNDSKKLSEKNRGILYDIIVANAVAYGIASADQREIDDINILKATFLAMNRAVGALAVKPDILLIDGNMDPGIQQPCKLIIGGDGKSASIAAASILAKVSRDRFMADISHKYPGYGFEKHKGYGTRLHYEKLAMYGPTDIHRQTFLRKWKNNNGESKDRKT